MKTSVRVAFQNSPTYLIHMGKPLNYQVLLLSGIFDLDPTKSLAFAKTLPERPREGEDWFAFCKLSAVAKKHFPETVDLKEQYHRALQLFTQLYRRYYGIRNNNESDIYSLIHRTERTINWEQTDRTLSFLETIEKEQGGDILILPAQLGSYYVGVSAHKVIDNLKDNEFGLTAFALGAISLVYPELYVFDNCLTISAIGDIVTRNLKFCPSFGHYCVGPDYKWLKDFNLKFDQTPTTLESEMHTCATAFMI